MNRDRHSHFQVLLQLVCGLIFAAGLWYIAGIVLSGAKQRRLPDGWSTIRPPSEVCAMAIVNTALWTGGKDGLVIIDRMSRETITAKEGQPRFSRVWALLEDYQGSVWVGHDGGLAYFQDGQWLKFDKNTQPGAGYFPLRRVLSLLELKDGRLLAGGENGVAEYSNGGWQMLAIPPEIQLPSYDTLFEDDQKTLWFASNHPNRGGMISFDGTNWRTYKVGESLPHPSVNTIFKSSRGVLWVATGFANRGGAAQLFEGVWTMLSTSDGLAGEKVRSIFEDKTGRLWFGSEYDGMAILTPEGEWSYLRPEHGLSGREIKVTLEDQYGYWLGTDGGLTFISK